MTVQEVIDTTLNLPKWAVVGASPNPERYGHKIVKLLMERGYTVYPIHPKSDEILGLRCYASITDVAEQIDVVDMVVNPKVGLGVMQEIRDAGIKHVWLQPGAESEEIHEFARANGISAIDACVLATLSIRRDHRIGG